MKFVIISICVLNSCVFTFGQENIQGEDYIALSENGTFFEDLGPTRNFYSTLKVQYSMEITGTNLSALPREFVPYLYFNPVGEEKKHTENSECVGGTYFALYATWDTTLVPFMNDEPVICDRYGPTDTHGGRMRCSGSVELIHIEPVKWHVVLTHECARNVQAFDVRYSIAISTVDTVQCKDLTRTREDVFSSSSSKVPPNSGASTSYPNRPERSSPFPQTSPTVSNHSSTSFDYYPDIAEPEEIDEFEHTCSEFYTWFSDWGMDRHRLMDGVDLYHRSRYANCYIYAQFFACAFTMPKCDDDGHILFPCPSMCDDFRQGCPEYLLPINSICSENYVVDSNESCIDMKVYCNESAKLPRNSVILSSNGSLVGSVLELGCEPGYAANGEQRLTCDYNGEWLSEGDIACARKRCEEAAPATPPNARVTFENGSWAGSIKTVRCDTGYEPQSLQIIQCNENGTWDGYDSIVCNRVQCTEPPELADNLIALVGNITYAGQRVDVECKPGHVLRGRSHIICTSNGTWDIDRFQTCTEIQCQKTLIPAQHAKPIDTENKPAGTVIHIQCLDGYKSKGNNSIYCNHDGYWQLDHSFDCVESPTNKNVILVISLTVSLIIVASGVIVVLFMAYRYKLEFKLYISSLFKSKSKITNEENPKKYHAFIAFHNDNYQYVRDDVHHRLEAEGYNICTCYNNFQFGEDLLQVIPQAIADSYSVLLILDQKFLDSSWCKYELRHSFIQLVEDNYFKVLVILLDKPENLTNVPRFLRAHLRTKLYMQSDDKRLFMKLRSALPRPNKHTAELNNTNFTNIEKAV